ncbi:uncharacterized protein DNG_01291 [Cephalotrichum gorgonifer]|uniref:C3H1-type domain-containing protein n=1 Tax=Cephalotrichum gorgonifer TaxID=2041049 RepID=A0AAE8MST5_9PEZI|nr:uncharacterized protein DNG_01291 [Cephalotrichum gorgonifer]
MSNYNYGPPPPPPPQAGHQPYGHHPNAYPPSTPSRGGGSHSRGRGGGYSTNYNTGRPEYQQPPSQSPYPYAGYSPQTPASYASDGSYQTPPQRQPEYAPAPPHASHAPAPLSNTNYHPNYTQPAYGGQPQYTSHPSYAAQAPSPYPPHYAAAPPASSPPQWSTPPAHQPQNNGYQGGRQRGGYQGDRGGSRGAPAMRVAYREEHPQPPANPGYGGAHYQDPRAVASYQPQAAPQQYHYAPPPPPPAHASSLPARHDSHISHGHNNGGRRGGRGGSFRDGNGRGRFQAHGGGDKQRHHKKSNNAAQEPNNQKSEQQQAHGKKKKRKVNTLGLIPGDASGSEDDDDGEESKLSNLMGSEVIQITDMAAFIAERKKRYPTKERVEAKKIAELAQKAEEKTEATLRLEREAEKLRRQLKKVESSIKRKREAQDEGDEMRESSPEADSDADVPEVQTSRAPDEVATPSSQAATAKRADISRHCKYYSTGGSCGKKGKCRFVHDPAVRDAAVRDKDANNGQLTIKQRLILNDKEQEDLTVLESIQYLREKGLMKPVSGITSKPGAGGGGGSGRAQGKSSKQPTSTPSTLPAPPPSLPQPPNKRENGVSQPPASTAVSTSTAPSTTAPASGVYEGWNLSGYGGTGIQPEDLP